MMPAPTLQTGLDHHRAGRRAEAENIYRTILAQEPANAEALHLLGVLALETKQFDAAIALIRQAITIRPDVPAYHNNLGNALRDRGELNEASVAFQAAIALDPRHAKAHYNLAKTLRDLDQIDNAMRLYSRAIELDPNYAKAHYSLGLLHLLRGDFARGWQEYEWRWRRADFKSPRRDFPQPLWDGSPLAGKTILLWPEQGMGDMIQFARYVPLLAERVKPRGRIILQSLPPLAELMRSLRGVDQVIATGEALPAFDMHLPLMSAPNVLQTTTETIPAEVPYLFAPPDRTRWWADRLSFAGEKLKVGLAWAGSPAHRGDKDRSISPELLLPIVQLDQIAFISLQKNAISVPPNVFDFTADLGDFADTAALIANLDLVITVDTATAHLAGAMNKPVWTLLPFAPDWRWMLDRIDSPWYPSMKLFRQPARGNWRSVIEELANQLGAPCRNDE